MHSRLSPRASWAVLVVTACSAEPDRDPPEGPDLDEDRSYAIAVEAGADVGTFLDVWGRGPDDAWAVGGQVPTIGAPGTGAVFHRDAAGWTRASIPDGTPLLNWIHGTPDAIWTVGNAGAALRRDGDGWRSMPTPTSEPLWGVFVFAADDVWAVGGTGFPGGTAVLEHFDGQAWSDVPLPILDADAAALFKVWGTSGRDVWAVGDNGVIVHYDGTVWAQTTSGTDRDLISLWGTGPDEIVAVGGRDRGVVTRWDGGSWRAQELPELPGLNGVWVNAGGVAVAVGNLGTAVWFEAGATAPNPLDTGAGFNVLHAVFGFADGTRYAVGGTLDRSPPYTGIVVESR